MMGKMYDKGHGVKRDRNGAWRYYKNAMNQGHLLAACDLAKLKMKGMQFFSGLSLLLNSLWKVYKVGYADADDWKINVSLKEDDNNPMSN